MKIAFCFLTQGDLLRPEPWEAFFESAPADRFEIYCHPKNPDAVTGRLLSGGIIPERVPTRHGDVSLVEATLALFSEAYKDEANEYFVLQSESAVPVTSFATVYDGLSQAGPRSVIRYRTPAPGTEHHDRLRMVEDAHRFASPFYFHTQWVVLHRRHVGLLLDRPYLSWFAQVFAADEHYFMNVLVHMLGVPADEIINARPTFVNWKEREVKRYQNVETGEIVGQTVHPKTYRTLTAADLEAAGPSWFFRKVSADCDCTAAIEQIRADERLRLT